MEEKIFKAPGCDIRYFVSDTGAEKWVVFLHGAGMDHRMFDEQRTLLKDQYNLLLWDARAHGQSRPATGDFSIRLLVKDLVGILDTEQCGPAIFIGQSMGGNLAQELTFLHPERVEKLVLIDCTCNTAKLSRAEKMAAKMAPLALKILPWNQMVQNSAHASGLKEETKAYVSDRLLHVGKKDFIRIISATLGCLHYEKGYASRKPMLLLCGEYDNTGNIIKAATAWAESEPYCTYHLVEQAGHNANQDNPEAVNGYIKEFLGN